jgi:hypothetical protein
MDLGVLFGCGFVAATAAGEKADHADLADFAGFEIIPVT